jgi:hypothetical protein
MDSPIPKTELGDRGIAEREARRSAAALSPEPGAIPSTPEDADPAAALAGGMDRLLRACAARATFGISPAPAAIAFFDWWLHLATSPGKQMELARKAARKWLRYTGFLSRAARGEQASNQLLSNWKHQMDTALRLIDAAVQGTLEMRSSQLAAAMETHARDLDAERSVIGAKSASDLMAIQMNWMTGNLERSMAYWNQMFQAAADANSKLVECLRDQAQERGPDSSAEGV